MGQGKQNGTFTQTANMPLLQLMSGDKYPKCPINLRRKNITKREVIRLLEVIWLPDELAIAPWGSIKRTVAPQTQENNYADQRARDAALGDFCPKPSWSYWPFLSPHSASVKTPLWTLQRRLNYSGMGTHQNCHGWWIDITGWENLHPQSIRQELVNCQPQSNVLIT